MEGELILEREIDPSRGSTNNSWCHFLARDSLRTDQLAIQRFTSTTKVKGNGDGRTGRGRLRTGATATGTTTQTYIREL